MTVNPGGEGDSPDPDAEETDVFLVMGADRRARKTREEDQETPRTAEDAGSAEASRTSEATDTPEAPEAPREHGFPPYRSASLSAPETETTAPGGPEEEADASPEAFAPVRPDASVPGSGTEEALPGDSGPAGPSQPIGAPPEAGTAVRGPAPQETGPAEASGRSAPGAGQASASSGVQDPERGAPYPAYGDRSLASTGFADIPAAPYAGGERPEPDRGVPPAEGRPDIPAPYAPTSDLPSPEAPAQEPPAGGIESWIDAVDDRRTPVQGGYEQRIAEVRSVPASSWRRAVFAVTGGRLNLG
ncbi:hypothetical protein [Nocardiopsis alborubida]|uniref:Uncharacterized protein n=1 Tax=Nocardiopsis alborubida TaxID=146802 RepID=A0A7X6MFR3_9ACTN|nr:hypothetical protein [Nocardiopsis alborubida]NKY99679.1 hypothetical protein [Nocardiopsis alborubida]